jgi:hypothetical protein
LQLSVVGEYPYNGHDSSLFMKIQEQYNYFNSNCSLYCCNSKYDIVVAIPNEIVATIPSTTSFLQIGVQSLQHNGQQYSQWIGNNPHIGKCREASGKPKDKFISLPTIAQLIRVNTRLILTKIWQYQCKWIMINSNGYPSAPPPFFIHHLYYINTP